MSDESTEALIQHQVKLYDIIIIYYYEDQSSSACIYPCALNHAERKKKASAQPFPPLPENDNYTHAGICLERGSCDAYVFSNWVSIKCAHTNIYQGTRWGLLIFSSSIRRLRLHTKEESVYYRRESNNNEVITSAGNFHFILLFNHIP